MVRCMSIAPMLLLSLLTTLISQAAASPLLNLTNAPVTFYFVTLNTTLRQIEQCSDFAILATRNPTGVVNATPPFHLMVAGEGMEPATYPASDGNWGWFDWTVDLPIGTNFSLAMADSAGGTGGLVSGYTVIPGPTNNCTIRSASSYSPITLDFPASNACDEIDMTIDGGQAPYTVSVLVGMTGLYSNTTSNTTSVRLQNSILQGETFNVLVTDSLGNSSAVSPKFTSRLHDTTCVIVNTTSFPLGATIGIVLGVVALLAVLGYLIYRYFRRRRDEATAAARDWLPASTAYRLSNGSTPLVTPFLLDGSSRPVSGISLTSLGPSSTPSEQGSASAYTASTYGDVGAGLYSREGSMYPSNASYRSGGAPPAYEGAGVEVEEERLSSKGLRRRSLHD